jgi:hypothetical protein
MRKLLTIFFLVISFATFSQTYVTKDTTIDGWLARISYVAGRTDSTNLSELAQLIIAKTTDLIIGLIMAGT